MANMTKKTPSLENSPWGSIWRSLVTIFRYYGGKAEVAAVLILATLPKVADAEYASLRRELLEVAHPESKETQENLLLLTDALRELHTKMPQAAEYTHHFCEILLQSYKGVTVLSAQVH